MTFDYIIIGSGPAGSVLSWNLSKKGFKVAIIDRATNIKKKSDKNSFIYSPYIKNCPNYYTPLFSNQLGGNSALWNNKVYLISKDEMRLGNWNIEYEELFKFSEDLSKKFSLNHEDISTTTNVDGLKYSRSLRAKKLGNIFNYLKIYENKNITVYDSSSPTSLNFGENNVVNSIILKNSITQKNTELFLNNSLIFCAGGLGNPNLLQNLLVSNNELIGKNLCDHPHINLANIKKADAKNSFKFGKYFLNNQNKYTEENFYHTYGSYFVGIQLDLVADPARFLKRIFIKTREALPKKIFSLLINYYSFFYKIVIKILSILNLKGKYSYEFFFSQKNNLENMIKLNNYSKDNFGLFKSDIIWDISKEEKNEYNNLISYLIGEKGILLNKKKFQEFTTNKILSGLHPSCTTLMGTDKYSGCVDKNLKLFDHENIYVCGSSVFSSNGFTNPTWTIMTLSNRLSKYLTNIHKLKRN